MLAVYYWTSRQVEQLLHRKDPVEIYPQQIKSIREHIHVSQPCLHVF